MEEIIPEKYYSAAQVAKMKVLPWGSNMTFIGKLKEPVWKAIFNPIIDRVNKRDMIHIKGENIIKFVNMARDGKINN